MMKRLLSLFFILATGAYGQTLFRYENVLINQSGIPIVGANVWVCSGNVTPNFGNSPPCTLAMVFSDLAGTQQISQPLISTTGSATQVGSFAFVVAAGTYTLAIKGAGVQASDLITVPNVTGTTTANNLLGPGTISGNFTGNFTVTGQSTITNPCAIAGLIYVSSSGCYTNLASAFAACSGNPCIIDMRGAPSATTLGTLDPGTAFPVTILLGPYSYTLTQLTVRTGLNFIGMGHGATTITQSSTSTIPFTMVGASQTYPNNVVNGATIKGFTLLPAASSGTDAFNFTAHAAVGGSCSTCGGGIEYSTFDDITVGTGWGGSPFKFVTLGDGTPVSLHQFNYFRNVVAFRAQNAVPTFWFTGQGGQFSFDNCQFDGNVVTKDTSANMYNIRIDDGALVGFVGPYSFHFKETTSQGAWGASGAAIFIQGAEQITFENPHFENDNGVIKELASSSGRGNWAIVIDNPIMGSSTAINSGNGFITSTDANSSVDIRNSAFNGTPDQIFIGASTKYVSSANNFNFIGGGGVPWATGDPWIVTDSGTCTMASGACTAQNLAHAFQSGKMFCTASWNGTGTLTGLIKVLITVSGGTGGVGTITPTSTVGTDTAAVWWICTGQAL